MFFFVLAIRLANKFGKFSVVRPAMDHDNDRVTSYTPPYEQLLGIFFSQDFSKQFVDSSRTGRCAQQKSFCTFHKQSHKMENVFRNDK